MAKLQPPAMHVTLSCVCAIMAMKLQHHNAGANLHLKIFHKKSLSFSLHREENNKVDFNKVLPLNFIPRGGAAEVGGDEDNDGASSSTEENYNSIGNVDFPAIPQTEVFDQEPYFGDGNDDVLYHPPSDIAPLQPPPLPRSASTNFRYNRHMTRSDERSILGRAVLTTPHRRMPAIRIAVGPKPPFASPMHPGPTMTATPIFATKSSLCESLGCALRDLRVIDQFSTSNERYSGPAFLARSNCVIVNVGHVRAIVMRDQVLIFLPEVSANGNHRGTSSTSGSSGDDSDDGNAWTAKKEHAMTETIERLVEALVTHLNSIHHSSHNIMFGDEIRGRTTDWEPYPTEPKMNSNVNQSQKQKNDSKNRKFKRKNSGGKPQTLIAPYSPPSSSTPPFELVVIEALLGHVCSFEAAKVNRLIKAAKDVLEGISKNFQIDTEVGFKKDAFIEMQAKLGELLPLKNKVDGLEAKCSEVAGAIAEVLKDDEDMAAMRLSEKNDDMVLVGDPNNLHVEVELLFEDYLLQMDEVLHSLRSVQNSIRNTEEVVEIELDLLRNRIMRYEMLLELSGLVVGVGAAVTGAFGMNLVNHFEEHTSMFYIVSSGLMVFMAAIGYVVLRKLSSDNIL